MAANTVEATLVSKYQDGITKGIEATQQSLSTHLQTMATMSHNMATAASASFDGVVGGANRMKESLSRMSNEADSHFKRIGLGAAAMGVAVALGLLQVGKSILSFLANAGKEASEVTELKLTFEGLSQAAGWQTGTFQQLRRATEGLVSSTDLLKNSNRLMQSGVKVTSDEYSALVGNIYRMAKASNIDGAQAVGALTDALIKGNARGLVAIGIHLNVKDAISEMAAAAGLSAKALDNQAQRAAFLNDLMQETGKAVAMLGSDYISIADAIQRGEVAWKSWFSVIGQGIGRSAVLEELLKRLVDWLWKMEGAGPGIEQIALKVNRFVIDALRAGAALLEFGGYVSTFIGFLWSIVKTAVNAVGAVVTGTLTLVVAIVTGVLKALSAIPGPQQKVLREATETSQQILDHFTEATRQFIDGAKQSFDGLGSTQGRMDGLAAGARSMADEMEKFAGTTVHGAAGLRRVGDEAKKAEADLKKLAEQAKAYDDLLREIFLRSATQQQAAYVQLVQDFQKIESLTTKSEQARAFAKQKAVQAYLLKIQEINQKERDEQEKHQQQLAELERASQEKRYQRQLKFVQVMAEAWKEVNLGTNSQHVERNNDELQRRQVLSNIQEVLRRQMDRSTPEWKRPFKELYDEINRLNSLNLSPFEAVLKQFKDNIVNIGSEVTNSWGDFWADLTSGQENAGKKFLASLLNIISQQLMIMAVRQTAMAIASFADLDFAGGARHLAAAAALGALGGIIKGFATNLAQANANSASQASSSSTSSSNQSAKTSVISVGAAGKAQNEGEASMANEKKPTEVLIKLALDRTGVLKVVDQNIRRNGRLRVAFANA